jgi:signal transduction histidine kinase
MKTLGFAIVFFLLCSILLPAQARKEEGYPKIRNYSPRDYGGDIQNWAVVQDKHGVMYFGNNLGLLEYDGETWTLTKVPSGSVIRSLVIHDDIIYAGSVGDIGYFSPDSMGKMKFTSFLPYLKPENKNFSDVWTVHIINDEVIYVTVNYIFKWSISEKKITVINSSSAFHVSFDIDNSFYIREWGTGILKLEGDSLKFLPGTERFANERIYVMLPFPGEENVILVVTRTEGMFKYDGSSFVPFKTEADEFIKKNLIYSPGRVLKDENIALITQLGGLIIIDKNGRIVTQINKAAGLPSNTNLSIGLDHTGGIWIATDYGISRVDYSSHVSYFDSRMGLSNSISKIHRYKGILYAAAGAASYYFDPAAGQFIFIPGLANQSLDFIEINGKLLAGTLDGVFEVEKIKVTPVRISVYNEYSVQGFFPSKVDTNRLYVATGEGLAVLQFEKGRWKDIGKILEIDDFATSVVEEEDGSLWVGTGIFGVYKINYATGNNGQPDFSRMEVIKYTEENGMPVNQVFPQEIDGKIHFLTPDNIYRFNPADNRFFADSTFMVVPPSGILMNQLISTDAKRRLWLAFGKQPVLGTRQEDGSFDWQISPFKRFNDEIIQCIYPEDSSTIWLGTGFGIIKYDFNSVSFYNKNFSVLIRQVSYGKDPRVFHSGYNGEQPEISFVNNSAKFIFAAAFFEDEEINQYKTFLEGFDEEWSLWSKENIKEYTNIPPGIYTFRVIGRNLEDITSSEASFSFVILPPWYRTWWAYAFYFLLFAALIFGLDRVHGRRLLAKEKQRSYLRETELRAEAAEAENERKKNIELLSEIGRDITANLSVGQIIETVYKNINTLMDAAVFAIGIYDPDSRRIVFPAAKENGTTLADFYTDINDDNRPAVWCFKNQKEVYINDYQAEYSRYIKELKKPIKGDNPESMIYLPLNYKGKQIGVITAQSFKKNAYTEYHLNILRNLAAYTAIAIDNADAYLKLNESVAELNTALDNLNSTQEKLVVQQKLASLGQLTAGIAHEIKNPLNFVNNFAQLTSELIEELKEEFSRIDELNKEVFENITEILSGIEINVIKINEHGSRANRIVNSMLQHSRGKSGERILSDINAILEEDLNLAYHGFRARDASFNISLEKNFDPRLEEIQIVPQDVSRVFLNVINNGFYETHKKKKNLGGSSYNPTLRVSTLAAGEYAEIRIRDNGSGIPADIRDNLFTPFFTTKPAGEGTGLGLSLSYDIIVKGHKGDIKFETREGEFTEFVITLPRCS